VKRLEETIIDGRVLKTRAGGTTTPSSHTSLHGHLVFSTKDRAPMISKAWRERLHAYLGGIARGLDAVPLAIGGIEDHVHQTLKA
jgi:REP element-mobilizing transposase RayT